jgi:hypothetical protein
MTETEQTHRRAHAVARALIEAMRCFAADSLDGARQRRESATRALLPILPSTVAHDCLLELSEIVVEVALLPSPQTLWAFPGREALDPGELRLILILVTLQRSDICAALEELTQMLGPSHIGGALFPMKSLAARLRRAGIEIGAVGERRFQVITGATQRVERAPAARPQLRVAR